MVAQHTEDKKWFCDSFSLLIQIAVLLVTVTAFIVVTSSKIEAEEKERKMADTSIIALHDKDNEYLKNDLKHLVDNVQDIKDMVKKLYEKNRF